MFLLLLCVLHTLFCFFTTTVCIAYTLLFILSHMTVWLFSATTNLQCNYTHNGLSIAWDSVGDSCYEGSRSYSVTIINRSNGMVVDSLQGTVLQNRLNKDIRLELDQSYNISFNLSQGSCETEQLYAECRDLDSSKTGITIRVWL